MVLGVRRIVYAILTVLLVGVATGCGAPSTSVHAKTVPASSPATPVVVLPADPQGPEAQLPGLPELPGGAADPVLDRHVSLADNFENGQSAVSSSHNGAFVNGTALDLGPAGTNHAAWAIWRWGAFQNGNQPRQIHLDLTLTGQNNYWVLLGNYTRQHWQVLGPVVDGAFAYTLTPGDNYLSPAANCYVGLVVLNSNKLTVNTLNLVCDNDAIAPGPPTALKISDVAVRSALLKWTRPLDDDLNHYELYSGPADSFALNDPGVTLLSDAIDKALSILSLTNLTPATTYYLRMRAFDTAGNASELSNTVSFTTDPNGPPVPAFTYNPADVQRDIDITFDPTLTTDPDDPPANLSTAWDWNNDGIIDEGPTPGLGLAHHAFSTSGPTTVTLTVSDGPASVSTSQSFLVGQHLETYPLSYALGGDGAEVLAADVDYSSGRIAAVVQGAGTLRLRYFNGADWSTVDMADLTVNTFCDVALAPSGKVLVLMAFQAPDLHQNWSIYETAGAAFSLKETVQVPNVAGAPQQSFGAGRLAVAANGRVTVAMATSQNPAQLGDPFRFYLSYMHEKSDGSFQTAVQWSAQPKLSPFGVERSDDTTYGVFLSGSQVTQAAITDAGSSNSTLLTVSSGTPQQLINERDPADNSHVSFAVRSSSGDIYYGDNFGAANAGTQHYAPSREPLTLLGMGLAGDNQGLFYWSDIDANDETWIRGYNSGTTTLSEVAHGAGLCEAGFGGWFNSGGTDGVYVATTETRDGMVTGYLLNGAAIAQQDEISTPIGGATVGNKALAFFTNDGAFTVLNTQQNPTALLHQAATVDGSYTHSLLGLDTWATPDCAASGTVSGDLILGSYYNSTDLLLYRFPPAATTGTYLAKYGGVGVARLQYNPVINRTMLVYTQNSGKNLVARLWDGASFSAPTTVYAGSTLIYEVVLRARPDGQWGVAWDDGASNVRLAETSGGVWQSSNLLASSPVYFNIGSIGFAYASNGDAGVAVERSTGDTGLYFGLKPAGAGNATWEKAASSQGFELGSINVHFLPGDVPTVLYYDNSAGVKLAQSAQGIWTAANLAFYIKGSPLVSVVDAAGKLAVAGRDNVTGEAAICVLSP